MKGKSVNLLGKPAVIVQNQGIKYSELLHQFIEPFAHELQDYSFTEDVIDQGILAWNTGNLKSLISPEDFDQVYNLNKGENSEMDLMSRMIEYKATHFKNHTNFIIDYELKETSGDPILKVITQEEKSYLAEMLSESKHENETADFEENYINRYAIVLKPAQPFIDWYTSFNPTDLDEMKETRIYLISEDTKDIEQWLKKKYDKLFTYELESFHDNKKEWPQKRNFKMFKEWFRIDVSSMIYDFENKPVYKSY